MVYQAIRLSKDMVWVVEELDEQWTPVHSLCHPLEVSGPFIILFPRNQKTFRILSWVVARGCKHS